MNLSNQVEFKKIREFGEIINDTFLFVKQNLKPLFKVFVYLCGFFILATLIAAIAQQLGMIKMIKNRTDYASYATFSKTNIFTVQYFFVIVFGLANYTAINVTVLSYISIYIKKGNNAPTVEEVWAYFKYYFFRALAGTLVVGGFMIPCFALCLIPGIYVFPALSLFFPIMIIENASIGYSFSRGFKLLKDYWWVTAGTILLIWIITYAVISLASLPALLFSMIGVFSAENKAMSEGLVILTTVIQYICQLFMVLPVIGVTLCYFNLTERHENTGLFDRINKLGEDQNPFKSTEEY